MVQLHKNKFSVDLKFSRRKICERMKVCYLQHNYMKPPLENVPRIADEILYNMDLTWIT